MEANWSVNQEHHGIEISFSGKPEKEILSQLKSNGFRWSTRQKIWYAKDTSYRREFAKKIASGGETVGEKISFAERMERKKERLISRQERLTAKARGLNRKADDAIVKARKMASIIPFGQPIIIGHHSEGRDRRYRSRIHKTFDKGFTLLSESKEVSEAAVASKEHMERMESPGVIQRRIERLEADKRVFERRIVEMENALATGKDYYQYPIKPENANKSIGHSKRRISEIQEQIDYWLDKLKETGAKIWGPDDFKKGDRVLGRHGAATVKRVNKKTLTVDYDLAERLGVIFLNCKLEYNRLKGKIE